MKVVSMIDRKIKGFPIWSKGKIYEVLKTEQKFKKSIKRCNFKIIVKSTFYVMLLNK